MVPRKLVEAAFSRIFLVLIPIVLAPLAVMVLIRPATVYEARATVWVSSSLEGARMLGYANPFMTPAQNQAAALNDLLSTESFRVALATRAELLEGSETRDVVGRVISNMSVSATPSGMNLLEVMSASDSPQAAAAIANATVDEFRARVAEELNRTSGVEVDYYEQQLVVAEQELAARQQALDKYLAEHPTLVEGSAAATQDMTYRTLANRVENQNETINQLNSALQAVSLRSASGPQALEAALSIQDEASAPLFPKPSSITTRLGLPVAAMLLGALISATYLYIVYRTDHTIRSPEDVKDSEVGVLGVIPELNAVTSPLRFTPIAWYLRRKRQNFARVAAATLPDGSVGTTSMVTRRGTLG